MNTGETTRTGFRPPAWATVAVIALAGIGIAAGSWQLERAAEKRGLFDAFDSGDDRRVLTGPVPDTQAESLRYRRMTLSGRYEPGRQVLLDNMLHDGRPGYQVLTPLRTNGRVVLVNRGWVAAGTDRDLLPVIPVDAEPRRVSGKLDLLPRPGLRIDAPLPGRAASWPRRLLYPTAEELSAQLGYPVADYQLLLDPGAPDGYVREWRPAVMGPERHVAYAVQWFALAAAGVVIYVVVNLRRARSR